MKNYEEVQRNKLFSGEDFENVIFDLLIKCCSNNTEKDGLRRAKTNEQCDILASNGISRLDLPKGTKIEIKKVGNPSNFKRLFLNSHVYKNISHTIYY